MENVEALESLLAPFGEYTQNTLHFTNTGFGKGNAIEIEAENIVDKKILINVCRRIVRFNK